MYEIYEERFTYSVFQKSADPIIGNRQQAIGRQRYAGGRADSVMPGGGPTALCLPSVDYA